MNPSRLFLGVITFALLFLFTLAVLNATASANKASVPQDPRKLIKSVDPKTSTIVIQYMYDKTVHVYGVDEICSVKVNNVPGKFADIKVGMEVKDYMERDNDNLDSISLQGYGEEPAAPKKK